MPYYLVTYKPGTNDTFHICYDTIYVQNTDQIHETLSELIEHSNFKIIKIHKQPDCEGCRLELLGQDAHMMCNTGCLHDVKNCYYCNTDYH